MDIVSLTYAALHVIWASGTIIFVLRRSVPLLNEVLTYGKFQTSPAGRIKRSKLFTAVLTQVIPTPVVWKSLYISGLTASAIYATIFNTYSNPIAILYTIQVARRLMECFYVHKFSKTRLLSLCQLVCGVSYYIIAPLTLHIECYKMAQAGELLPATRFCAVSYPNTNASHKTQPLSTYPVILTIIVFIFLILHYAKQFLLIFAVGSISQHIAHRILANITPKVGKYGLPHGFLFRYVICPHYLAEIVVYAAFVFALRRTGSFLLFACVVANLTDSALRTREWYATLFSSEMKGGHAPRAIIPFLL